MIIPGKWLPIVIVSDFVLDAMFETRYAPHVVFVFLLILCSWFYWDENRETGEENVEMDVAKIGKNLIKSVSTGEVRKFCLNFMFWGKKTIIIFPHTRKRSPI